MIVSFVITTLGSSTTTPVPGSHKIKQTVNSSSPSEETKVATASQWNTAQLTTTGISSTCTKHPMTPASSQDTEQLTTIIQDTNYVTSYASDLRGLYTNMSHSHTSQHWTHLPRCEYIQLAMIQNGKIRCGGPEEEFVRLAQQGKIETVMSKKEQVNLKDIFPSSPQPPPPPPPPPPSPSSLYPMSNQLNEKPQVIGMSILPPLKHGRVVLIEGAPGGGKSTLALHICHQWAEGISFLAKFDVVVLAYLRDQAVQNARTLADILPTNTFHGTNNVATQITDSNGLRILFLFDGWDEFPPALQNNSLVSTIIREPHKLNLHQSTVIITTRPVASANLLRIADRRVEILGFTQKQICAYIEKALDGNSTHIQKLVRHLEENPVIEGYCYIPLHAAILVHIFLTMEGVLPTTLHELFCNLVLCCIVRELETHESVKIVADFSSLNDLPDVLKSQLSDLCVLAYVGVMQNKVVFYRKDLEAFHLPTNLQSLGLLQAVEGLTVISKSLSYNFLHLSVQELLAAYHISQMDPSKQVEVFKEMFGGSRFQAVLHYYCGFTKLGNPVVQEFISTYSQQKGCLKGILPLLHCFFEAQQPSLCQLVDYKLRRNILLDFQNPMDYLALGYFISSLLSTSTTNQPSVHLVVTKRIDDHCLKLLTSQLSRYPLVADAASSVRLEVDIQLDHHEQWDLPHLAVGYSVTSSLPASLTDLSLKISQIDDQNWNDLLLNIISKYNGRALILDIQRLFTCERAAMLIASHLQQSLPISELLIHDTYLDQEGNCLLHLAEALQINSSLTKLQLSNVKLRHTAQNGLALNKMFRMNRTLTHLDLSGNQTFLTSGAHCIFQGLQHNYTLVHLDLNSTGMVAREDTVQPLAKMLEVNMTLTHLNLSHNKLFSGLEAHYIFQGLQHNSTLVHLDLSSTGIVAMKDTVQSLTKMLEVNMTLTYLNLSHNKLFSDLEAHCIFQGLQHNTALVSLDLSDTRIAATEDTVQTLTKMLEANKTLTHLELSYNRLFSDSKAQYIFQGLQHNTTLVHLNLRCTEVTNQEALHIARVLESNSCSLQTLNISHNVIGDRGFAHIDKSLELNTSLRTLKMNDNYCHKNYYNRRETVQAIHRRRQQKGLYRIAIF